MQSASASSSSITVLLVRVRTSVKPEARVGAFCVCVLYRHCLRSPLPSVSPPQARGMEHDSVRIDEPTRRRRRTTILELEILEMEFAKCDKPSITERDR